jgi:hypothetical protein
MLVLGVLLLLVAAFGGLLFGRSAPAAGRLVRLLAGIGGAAVIGWILIPQLTTPAPTVSPAVAVTNPEPAPPVSVDVMGIATLALEDCSAADGPAPAGGVRPLPRNRSSRRAQRFQAYDAHQHLSDVRRCRHGVRAQVGG